MAKRVRLADIAERVGVSPKTVSNVVNDTGSVSAVVRERILATIDELGYQPNLAARELRSGQSNMIALAVPRLSKAHFAEFVTGIIDAGRARGVTVLVLQSRGNRVDERAIIEGERLPALGGIILNPLALTPEDIAARNSTVPLLFIGEHGLTLAAPDVTHVGSDNIAGSRAATEFLLANGGKRIAAIGLQNRLDATAQVRFAGYRAALESAGIAVDPDLLVHVADYNRAEGSRAIEELLARGAAFDSVFCFNDSLASGAVHALARHGIIVPDDVSVIGYDNTEESRYMVPSLPSIDTGLTTASDLILDILLNPDHSRGGSVELPFTLRTGDVSP